MLKEKIIDRYKDFLRKEPNQSELALYLSKLKKVAFDNDFSDLHLFAKGALLLLEGSSLEGYEYLIKSENNNPDLPLTLNRLGLYYYHNEKYNRAIQYFQKAIKSDPSWYLPYLNLADLYIDLEIYDYAESSYLKALDIEPENQTIRSNLSLLKPKDRQKEYLRFIKKNIQLEPIGKIVNTEESSSHVKEIEKVLGFYIFADINGFTEWSSNHNQNIINLMEIFIPTAYDYFGEIDKTKQDNKHIVKFLGDGFFAFQHLKDTYSDFNRDLCDLLTRVIDFMERLKEKINRPSIPENKKLTMRFGISYGKTVKLGYGRKDQVYDYIGKEVNIASRICNYQFDEISSEDGIIAMDTTDNPSIEEFLSATYPKMEVLNEIELKGIHDRRKIIIIP